jgi:hypothetical protein
MDAVSSSNYDQSLTLGAMQCLLAYRLHCNLVIRKGSYGQVCTASRGKAGRGTVPTGLAIARSLLESVSCFANPPST